MCVCACAPCASAYICVQACTSVRDARCSTLPAAQHTGLHLLGAASRLVPISCGRAPPGPRSRWPFLSRYTEDPPSPLLEDEPEAHERSNQDNHLGCLLQEASWSHTSSNLFRRWLPCRPPSAAACSSSQSEQFCTCSLHHRDCTVACSPQLHFSSSRLLLAPRFFPPSCSSKPTPCTCTPTQPRQPRPLPRGRAAAGHHTTAHQWILGSLVTLPMAIVRPSSRSVKRPSDARSCGRMQVAIGCSQVQLCIYKWQLSPA